MSVQSNRFKSNSSPQDIQAALLRDGFVIVEDVLSSGDLEILKEQIKPHLEAAKPDGDNAFMGQHTVRFGRLLHRVPKVREMALHPVTSPVIRSVLTANYPTYQLHFTGVMHVTGGASSQVLHRDNVLFTNPSATTVVATMWAVEDFSRDNGATVFVPGSHLWAEDLVPQRRELAVAEMTAGSVLIYLGNLIHGAGSCKQDLTRTGVSLQYCVGWMRQEENQYLATPLEEARTFNEDLQRLMGYDLASRHWGYVDQQHPLDFLQGTNTRSLDTEGYGFPSKEFTGISATIDKAPPIVYYYPVSLD